MTTITFAQIAKDFRISAGKAKIPETVIVDTLGMLQPPCDTGFAISQALRWSNALPNDPAGSISIDVISGGFKKATTSWENAQRILQATSTMARTVQPRVQERLEWPNWDQLRAQMSGSVPSGRVPSKALFDGFDRHADLIRTGKVGPAVEDSLARSAKANQVCANLYDELLKGKSGFTLRQKKNWDDYWDAAYAGGGAVLAAGATGFAYS
jgi:hypothetical protein